MRNLSRIKTGSGGEIQLTDAIAAEIDEEREVFGYQFRGERFDCGSKAGFLQATVAFGLAREDLGAEFGDYLQDMMSARRAAQ
jgi:UTP--glucose-1-phosphate uridylyltransferase